MYSHTPQLKKLPLSDPDAFLDFFNILFWMLIYSWQFCSNEIYAYVQYLEILLPTIRGYWGNALRLQFSRLYFYWTGSFMMQIGTLFVFCAMRIKGLVPFTWGRYWNEEHSSYRIIRQYPSHGSKIFFSTNTDGLFRQNLYGNGTGTRIRMAPCILC